MFIHGHICPNKEKSSPFKIMHPGGALGFSPSPRMTCTSMMVTMAMTAATAVGTMTMVTMEMTAATAMMVVTMAMTAATTVGTTVVVTRKKT